MASSLGHHGHFVYAGKVTPDDLKHIERVTAFLSLTGGADDFPASYLEAVGAKLLCVPTEVPAHMTRAHAAKLGEALEAASAAAEAAGGKVVVQCATGNRASAAILLHLALKNGWSVEQAFAYGREHGLKCMAAEPMKNWLIAALAPLAHAPLAAASPIPGLIFRQLFEPVSSTYTYILGDPVTGHAVIIDPVLEKVNRDLALCAELGLTLTHTLNTHVHADHVSASHSLKAAVPGLKSGAAAASKSKTDLPLSEGDVIPIGASHSLTVVATPGHTDGCLSYLTNDKSAIFTGDALFVRGCGRTDFQQGDAVALYRNIHTKVFTLPDSTRIYPGHDYNGHLHSTVGEERKFNPRLNKTEAEFVAIMAGLNLPRPKQIDVAVPANMADGDPAAIPAPAPAAAP